MCSYNVDYIVIVGQYVYWRNIGYGDSIQEEYVRGSFDARKSYKGGVYVLCLSCKSCCSIILEATVVVVVVVVI